MIFTKFIKHCIIIGVILALIISIVQPVACAAGLQPDVKNTQKQETKKHDLFSDLEKAISNLKFKLNSRNFDESWFRTLAFDPFANSLFPDFASSATKEDTTFIPRIDITEDNSQIKVTAEVPGLDENSLDVSITDNNLTLKGEKVKSETKNDKGLQSSERVYGKFERVIQFPSRVNSSNADAFLKDGILTIIAPKSKLNSQREHKLNIRRVE